MTQDDKDAALIAALAEHLKEQPPKPEFCESDIQGEMQDTLRPPYE